MDQQLWRLDRYIDFLEERKRLLAAAANRFLEELLHGPLDEDATTVPRGLADFAVAAERMPALGGGVDGDEEEQELLALNSWVVEQGLPAGEYLFEVNDEETGEPLAIFDLAWPAGLQPELSAPVAVLIGEAAELLALANERGYRYFTSIEAFKRYVVKDVLALEEVDLAAARA